MRILLLGANGQVGHALRGPLAAHGEVVASTRSGRLPDGSPCLAADLAEPGRLPALVRTTTFRLALLHASIFILFSASLLAYLYYETAGHLSRQAEAELNAEFQELSAANRGGFDRLNQALAEMGIELKSGQIIDATFVPVPIQRNGRENNALIKVGAVPIEWGQDADQPNKLAHKDTDARWTKKGGQNHYGYKNHINIDKDTKLIASHACTDASVHDSQVLDAVLRGEDEGGKEVWADSAYRSEDQEQSLKDSEHTSQINERAYRSKPLTEAQEVSNKAKSRVRARVEHVFGHMENSMGGIFVRTIGIARAKVGVTLMNLTYNLSRIEVLIRNKTFAFERISAPKMGAAA